MVLTYVKYPIYGEEKGICSTLVFHSSFIYLFRVTFLLTHETYIRGQNKQQGERHMSNPCFSLKLGIKIFYYSDFGEFYDIRSDVYSNARDIRQGSE